MSTTHSGTAAPTRGFTVEGRFYSTDQMLSANRDDVELCEWLKRANVGDRFPALIECVCVAAATGAQG